MNRHLDLGRTTFIPVRAQPIADDLFPSPDGRLDLRTPVVARGCLPRPTASLGDTAEVAVALCRRGVCGSAWHRRGTWRHNQCPVRLTVGNSGINTVLIVGPITC